MNPSDAVDVIPPPTSIRRDLAVVYRRADLLRRLLRLAEQKQRQLSPAALAELDRVAPRESGVPHAS
jgi:hypothetical protein